MLRNKLKSIIAFVLLCFFITGCVSKKKHLATVQSMRTLNENVVNNWQKKFNVKRQELAALSDTIQQLELNLAERKGENNILNSLRKELEIQIENMESQMNNLGTTSKSAEQNLKIEIQKKETEINNLRLKLTSINSILNKNKEIFNRVSGDLAYAMESINADEIIVGTQLDRVVVVIQESQLFKKGRASRITDSGFTVLEKISGVLNRYPQLLFDVIGHTDTTPANKKKYKDNWNYSSLQATSVVRTLVTNFDMNSSQLTASGKGEYEPRSSNATSEGKRQNRRIEIFVYRPLEDLAKEIRAITNQP